jgi:TonB family protein
MRIAVFSFFSAISSMISPETQAATSDWLSAPKPKFPARALQKGSEGSVKLRIVLAKDGSLTSATVLKSSGDSVLDQTAQNTVMKWKMKPSAIKASDLGRGRDEVIEFKQEAVIAATYPRGGKAAFASEKDWKPWTYAPFPCYPMDARLRHHTGTVVLGATIGSDGRVVAVQMLKTSGYNDLDEAATTALRHWRAHKEFAGRNLRVPATFVLTPRR